jgi:hypothetical protein
MANPILVKGAAGRVGRVTELNHATRAPLITSARAMKGE